MINIKKKKKAISKEQILRKPRYPVKQAIAKAKKKKRELKIKASPYEKGFNIGLILLLIIAIIILTMIILWIINTEMINNIRAYLYK